MRGWRLVAVCLVLVAGTVLAPSVGAATFCGGTATIDEELRVAPGEELTVCPGTSLRGEGRVVVEGTLRVEGTAGEPVTVAVPIVVQGGNASLNWTGLAGVPGVALHVDGGNVTLRDVTVEGSARGLVVEGNASHVEGTRVTFRDHGDVALRVAAPTSVELRSVVVNGSNRGLVAEPGAGRVVLEDAVLGNTSSPVTVQGEGDAWPRVVLRGVHVGPAAPVGVRVEGEGNRSREDAPVLELVGSRVEGSAVGLALEGSGYTVESRGSTYVGNGVGVRTEGAWATFRGDTFRNTRWDVEVAGPADRVQLVNATLRPGGVHVVGEDEASGGAGGAVAPLPATRDALLLAAGFLGGVVLLAATTGREAVRRDVVLPVLGLVGPEEARDPDRREAVLRAVANHPGAPEEGVAALAGLEPRWAAVHLAALERAGRVVRTREGEVRRFVPAPSSAGEVEPEGDEVEDPLPLPSMGDLEGMERRVFEAIREVPGLGQADVARRVGVTRQAVHYHVKKLEGRGLVRRERDGRRTRCYPLH